MVVSVQNVFLEFRMTGNVDLRHTLCGHAVDVREWIEVVVPRGNVNIIYIQKDSAIRPLHHFIQELPFGHLRNVKFGVTAHVLDGYWDLEKVPHFANLLSRNARSFKRIGHGKEVVRVMSIDAAPAEVVGEPRSVCALDEFLQPPEVFSIRLLRRAEIHRDTMLDDFVLIEDLVQNVQRPSAVDHEILRNDFKPVHNGFARKNMLVMWGPQAYANPVIRKRIKTIRSH